MVTVPLISVYRALFITSLPSRVSEGSRKLAVMMDAVRGPSSCAWPSSPRPGAWWILGLSVVGLACKGHTAVLIVSRDLDEALSVFLKPLSFAHVTQFHSGSRAATWDLYLIPHLENAAELRLTSLSPSSLPSFQGKPLLLSSFIIFRWYPRIPLFNVKSSLGTWRRI